MAFKSPRKCLFGQPRGAFFTLSFRAPLPPEREEAMRSLTSLFPQHSVVASTLCSPKTAGIMCSASSSYSATSSAVRLAAVHPVPSLTADEISAAASEAFARHSAAGLKRSGNGVAIVWFRNDLRVVDNEALLKAWVGSSALLPVYFVDPRHFALRAKFLLECLHDLKKNLKERGLDLLVKHGSPEDILPSIAKAFGAHTVKKPANCTLKLLSLSILPFRDCDLLGCSA
ncbi:Cryptochrome DASH, chloroplastic/mitochondrial [Dendrobium catenatum]|uniref:Cryptochrome DASH, chloroplastic/mitochondrial n=1 Tax=Dendrobium catenatum TaxID=906689 RepID=A0A2I0X6G8_9ASPA|nr:Cryptochrome DASH, chloroplastic/mitochondrial [Dendrobium catenatum]